MNKIITISRQFGSGGREIGEKLSNIFGIPFYDKELITRAAKESGLSEHIIKNAEDKAQSSLLYSIAKSINAYGNYDFGYTQLSLDDRVYLAQAAVINKVAEEGPCVIIGRCADYILKEKKNVIHVFIWADLDFRMNHAIANYDFPKDNARENIIKIDKSRANYYNYHASKKWGKAENYHLCIKSDYSGIDHAVLCIKQFIEMEKS